MVSTRDHREFDRALAICDNVEGGVQVEVQVKVNVD
jgi:hypothetical protein